MYKSISKAEADQMHDALCYYVFGGGGRAGGGQRGDRLSGFFAKALQLDTFLRFFRPQPAS